MTQTPATGARLAQVLFQPRSIALIGASGDARKNTSRPQRYLRKHGYTGRIIPINPGRDEIFGEKAYPDLQSVPEEIDQAFIMVPADLVEPALVQCVAKQVPVVTIYSDGFAETGEEGRRKQERLLEIARKGGVRLVGPNCIGHLTTEPSCALSVNAVLEMAEIRKGSVALVSQSGSMIGGLMSRGLGRGVGFSKLISVGNEADIGVGELTGLMVEDPHTKTILLFMETIRDADKLSRAALRANELGKQIIVFKLGRSEVGQDLAASHTGALAGSDEMADTFFRAHGMPRVDMLETLFELPHLLVGQQPRERHRVAVMTTTGGGAASVVDRLGLAGVDVVGPTDAVVANLAKKNIHISKARLTDLTLAGAKKEIYSAVLNELLASDHCDLVLAVVGSSAQFQPEIAIEPIVEAQRNGKALAVFLAPQADRSLGLLYESGVAAFRTPESCADGIAAWAKWRKPLASAPVNAGQIKAAQALLEQYRDPQLNEYRASEVFAALGVNVAQTQIIKNPDDPVSIKYPVVAKILSPDILHKTDAGGVVLNIKSADELRAAAKAILEKVKVKHPDARIEGILVQAMERGISEVILGYKRDAQVGPVVLLGVGGVLAEIYKDFAVRLAPVTENEAQRMIDEVKGLAVIRGYRGMPEGDRAALAKAVSAYSQLASLQGTVIQEAEINPLIVKTKGEGITAVDGVLVRT
jgi:acyl-CoA synthetase (NDP forming)